MVLILTLFLWMGFAAAGMAGDYTDNGDGTVTDNDTGLMWMNATMDTNNDGVTNSSDEVSWQEALAYCENATFAGYDDWRLPNIKELRSIVDYSMYYPAINTDYFNAKSSYYWSSTTRADDVGGAWVVDFYYGNDNYYGKSSYFYVRAVRSGQ